MLPKTLTPKLVGELNAACDAFKKTCECECDDVGWCDVCWMFAAGEIVDVECYNDDNTIEPGQVK